MNKKEYILKLLTALDGKWSMAAGLKLLIEHNVLNDQTIVGLQHIFAESIKQVNDQKAQEYLLKSQTFLQKLQAVELQEQSKEDDLNKLLADI
ncbi:TPA: hypothetical protein DIC40_04085 [Patescibacteria group bacterium]|nr:hypothetical protein P148_SR1C00001G0508 [candidate division SR1 bacterium RAAC1_SR1_1]HCY21011.1 hypothetical protein [Candidatus Gracilibacteria bacterium]